jgi:hypothetical protein
MIAKILAFFGYKIVYTCSWGEYPSRYDSIDLHMMRPVHPDMSVAPPWAKMEIRKI